MDDAAGSPRRERRIVCERRRASHHHSITPGPEAVNHGTRFRPGDPTGLACRRGDASIQRAGQLQGYEGSSPFTDGEKAPMLLAALVLENADFDPDTGSAQTPQAGTGNLRMRIPVTNEDETQSGVDHPIGAWPSTSGVGARFESDCQAGATNRPRTMAADGAFDGDDLSMRSSDRACTAASKHPVAAVDDRTHRGIRMRPSAGAPGLREGPPHGGLGPHCDSPPLSMDAKKTA